MKGLSISDLLPAIIVVIVIALAGSFAATILNGIQAQQSQNTAAYNITGYGMTSLLNMEAQLPNVALILIVAVIIGVLVGSFVVYQARK